MLCLWTAEELRNQLAVTNPQLLTRFCTIHSESYCHEQVNKLFALEPKSSFVPS